jgi:hypothetical protein
MTSRTNMSSRTMSDDQKASMAEGRRQSRVVKTYLRFLEGTQGRKKQRNLDEIDGDLVRVDEQLESAHGVDRLTLLQEREDLQRQALEAQPDNYGAIEEQFITVARSYSDRKGISYSTWREFGVSKNVLQAAGIPRTRRPNNPT